MTEVTPEVEPKEVTSYMDVYRTMADVIFPVPGILMDDSTEMQIHVHKLGGASPDEKHAGTWICELFYKGELLYSTAEVVTGMPYTFYMVSGVFADWLVTGESVGVDFSHFEDRLTDYARRVNEESEGIF